MSIGLLAPKNQCLISIALLLLAPILFLGSAQGQESPDTMIIENPSEAPGGVVRIDPVEMTGGSWRSK